MRKTTILSLIILLVSTLSYGQDTIQGKKNEFVFSLNTPIDFTSLSFGVGYKRAVAKNKFLKFNIPRFDYMESSTDNSNVQIIGSISIGFEFRHNIDSKLIFFHGPNIGYYYQHIKSNANNPSNDYILRENGGSVSYTLGLQFKVNESISLSTQLSPSYSIYESNTEYPDFIYINSRISNNGFSLNNEVGMISVVFHF